MSLFADKWSSPQFDSNPFGLDTFYSSSFGSAFGDRSDGLSESPRMKIRNGSTFVERGFYDHFDSVFHGRSLYSEDGKRQGLKNGAGRDRYSPVRVGRGKEYVIPIKIETSPSSSTQDTSSSRLDSGRLSSSSKPDSASGKVIEIPIIRHTSSSSLKSNREKSRSPLVADGYQHVFSEVLTPTTDKESSKTRNGTEDVYNLNSEDFFAESRKAPFMQTADRLGRKATDIEVIEIDEEEEVTITSLRRKPLRHAGQDTFTSSSRAESSLVSENDVADDYDVSRHEVERTVEREEGARKRKDLQCSNSGQIEITPSPSYPIYDHLKPRLARVGRQVDYIRGDGNCLFRALSKEMQATEDCHAEWRQAVCDLVIANPATFSQYIDGGCVSSHVAQMRELGAWATTCEIYAAATLLRRRLYVLAPAPGTDVDGGEYHWLLFSPRPLLGSSASSGKPGQRLDSSSSGSNSSSASNGGGRKGRRRSHHGNASVDADEADDDVHPCYVTLCHTNGNHYDRIAPVFAACNCELPPPNLNGVSLLLDLTSAEEEELFSTL